MSEKFIQALMRFQARHLNRLLCERYGNLVAVYDSRVFRFIGGE